MTVRSPRTLAVAVIALVAALAGTAIADQEPSAVGSGKPTKLAKKAGKNAKKAIEIAEAAESEPGPQGGKGGGGAPGAKGERGPSGEPLSGQASLVADDDKVTLLEAGNVRLVGYCLKASLSLPSVAGWVGAEVDAAGPRLVLDDAVTTLAPGMVVFGNSVAAAGPVFGLPDGATRAFTVLDGTKSVSGVASVAVNVSDDECRVRAHAFV